MLILCESGTPRNDYSVSRVTLMTATVSCCVSGGIYGNEM